MFSTKTKLTRTMVGAALYVTLSLSAAAFAADSNEVALTSNEHSAQEAIVYSPVYGSRAPFEPLDATLAHNESAASRAIAAGPIDSESSNVRMAPVPNATIEATLAHNELSAQHAIADAQPSSRSSDAGRSSAALNSSPSNPSVAPR